MRLNVVEEGSGDRVAVLLHGMMGSAESWWRVSRALAAGGYRVLALDLPGHGGSPRDPGLTAGRTRLWSLPEGSIVVRARPSAYVTDQAADDLRSQGVAVRDIPGAGHSIWFGHFTEFVEALPEVFAPTA